MERRVVAILAGDMVGYNRLMREEKAGMLAALKSHPGRLIEPETAEHTGRIAPRCEKTRRNFSSFVALAATFILTKSIHTT